MPEPLGQVRISNIHVYRDERNVSAIWLTV